MQIVRIDLCFVFRNPEHKDGKPLAERLSDAEPDDSKEYAKLKSYKDFVSKCLKVKAVETASCPDPYFAPQSALSFSFFHARRLD